MTSDGMGDGDLAKSDFISKEALMKHQISNERGIKKGQKSFEVINGRPLKPNKAINLGTSNINRACGCIPRIFTAIFVFLFHHF